MLSIKFEVPEHALKEAYVQEDYESEIDGDPALWASDEGGRLNDDEDDEGLGKNGQISKLKDSLNKMHQVKAVSR